VQHARGLSKAPTTGSLRVRSRPAINQREEHAIRIAATALNFNFDTEPGIVRVDYVAEFDQSKRMEGTMGFSFFDIQGDPLRARSPDVDVVPFTGRFVPVVKIDP
jgi:hypothetical protein